ncbi:hypothetical protein ACFYNL_21160 [Streptomyces sp. NPDC007808]|uniref:hypothetical protein n=1 Tax=Streptomyces sp. NPDC007808 TaxID=3364779 RepID=UPI00368F1A41
MLVLGLLLLAATGVFTGLVIADNLSGGPDHPVTVLGRELATMNTLAVFCSGLALALLFCLGLALVKRGATHHRPHGQRRRTRRSPFHRTPEPGARA